MLSPKAIALNFVKLCIVPAIILGAHLLDEIDDHAKHDDARHDDEPRHVTSRRG